VIFNIILYVPSLYMFHHDQLSSTLEVKLKKFENWFFCMHDSSQSSLEIMLPAH